MSSTAVAIRPISTTRRPARSQMAALSRRATTKPATTGRAAAKARRWWGISTVRDCATTKRRIPGIHLTCHAVRTVAAAKPTSAAPAATACSIALPLIDERSSFVRQRASPHFNRGTPRFRFDAALFRCGAGLRRTTWGRRRDGAADQRNQALQCVAAVALLCPIALGGYDEDAVPG